MFDLQVAIDERLAALKGKKPRKTQDLKVTDTSREYIMKAWRQAGIVDKNGKMVRMVTRYD